MNNTTLEAPAKHSRIFSIDIVRGMAIVLMALDHTRDFFSSALYDPTNLVLTYPAMFLTRWITHFCAAAFVFLAGTSAFLYRTRGNRTKGDLTFFLLSRGIWLIILEFTLVQWGWAFNFSYLQIVCQVMWVLGWSMIALSVLIYLPRWLILSISIAMIAGHNLLDKINIESWGNLSWLLNILHVPGDIALPSGIHVQLLYPLIPWIGVMALGYAMGGVFLKEPQERKKQLLRLGISLIFAFFVIRAINIYGDPYAWVVQKKAIFTALSFINYTKYPPSFLFLLMTLGVTFVALSVFTAREPGRIGRFFLIYGRVPLFFYAIHVPIIHFIAVIFAFVRYGHVAFLFHYNVEYLDVALSPKTPLGYGYGLAISYIVWISVIAMLYPLCRWYAVYKKNHPQYRLLSYL